MPDIDIRFPIKGISDDVAFTEQEPGTTSDALNMRGLDPVTGRERGAQREGLSKFTDPAESLTGKVSALMSISYDLRNIDYTAVTTADETGAEWSFTTPGGGPCHGLVVDNQENVLCLSGPSSVVKLNSEGVSVWEHGIKVTSKGQVLKAIAIDNQGGVFVGSTTGGDPRESSIWRIVETTNDDEEYEPEDYWNLQPGGFVKHLEFSKGALYAAIDIPEDGRSEVVVYSQAASSSPNEAVRYAVPYPINHVGVDPKGSMVVSCPKNDLRGFNPDGTLKVGSIPSSPESTVSSIGWSPKDLDDWEKRVWFWIDADDLDPASAPYEVGDEITFVRSKDKSGRHLYTNTIDDEPGPTFGKGLAGRGAIQFDGITQSLISGPATTNLKSNASSQQSSFPCYEGGMYATFILIRPNKESDSSSVEGVGRGTLFSQLIRGTTPVGSTTGTVGYGYLSSSLNCGSTKPVLSNGSPTEIGRLDYCPNGLYTGGLVDYVETATGIGNSSINDYSRNQRAADTAVGSGSVGNYSKLYNGTHLQTFEACTKDEYYNIGEYGNEESWAADDEAVLITIINDGSVDTQTVSKVGGGGAWVPNGGPPPGKTRSLIRVNGVPVDRWTDMPIKSKIDSYTTWGNGYNWTTSADDHFGGEILEVITLDRIDRNDDSSEPKILTHPEDPDYVKSITMTSNGSGYTVGGDLRAVIHKGVDEPCGGAHMPQSGNSLFGSSGTPGASDYISWVKIGTYTVDPITGSVDTNTFSTEGCGWMNAPEVYPEDDVFFGGSGSGCVIEAKIHEDYSGSSAIDDDTTEMEKIEGYLVHKWGCPNILPGDGDRWIHPYQKKVPQAAQADGSYSGNISQLLEAGPIVAHYDSTGELSWAFGDDSSSEPRCGISAAFLEDGSVATLGTRESLSTSYHGVSCISKDGLTATVKDSFTKEPIAGNIVTDEFDAIHFARSHSSSDADNKTVSVIRDEAVGSTALFDLDLDGGVPDDSRDAYGVGVAPFSPDYGSDIAESNRRSQFIYVATSDVRADGTGGQPTVWKYRTVSVSPNMDPPRGMSHYAVGYDGELKQFTAGGANSDVTNGDETPDFAASASFIDHTALFNKLYVVDGVGVKVIDPVAETVSHLKAEDGGKLPDNPRLVAAWRGRLVLARMADDPHAWVMSEKDNPKGWNTAPIDDTSISATAGSLSLAGRPQDVINCLIPYSDDILIVGCDHSIWTLTGDPLLGGQIDLLTDVTGIAFGRSWAKDPRGNIFFFGSRGGVFAMPPTGAAPVKITESSINRRMADVDLGTYRMELVWNERQEGLHVYQIPYAEGGALVRHWFWDRKRSAWWEDEFGSTGVQVTASAVLDGDTADDRVVLVGGEDGVIRQYESSAKDDDGEPIESRVLLGPIVPKSGEGKNIRFSHLATTLASDQDGAIVRQYVSNTADLTGEHFLQDSVPSGRAMYQTAKAKGGYYWVELVNSSPNERFAFEAMSVRAYPAGRRRSH